ncbi:serine/threonine-protein kinase [Anaerosolibacter carboniphilus]|uniref:Serine/threonine-protein kinase n=1 Tax=Anaerosolibacter carboniphilus TaxID=1417629 RepID=A0A841KXW1_9FIRM|nr:protein kinase [Anaerosolibacter carboniphilus]MBB6218474.1 serine/threonine-protein kinase [Anaerosolibacter carboniphilus]
MMGIRLSKGSMIRGKWSQKSYRVLELLGEGGIGAVYKVQEITSNEIYALKLSEDLQSITKEYDMLKKFENLSMVVKAKEIDDLDCLGHRLYYMVTECIDGKNLDQYRKERKISLKSVVALAIVIGKAFQRFHQENYVFGDMKLENLMLDQRNGKLKIIDLGGVTRMGEGLKEFTPTYDRASWGVGLRKADEKYDLFSLCILITYLVLGNEFPLREKSVDKVIYKLKNVDIAPRILELIHKGITQKDMNFSQFISSLEKVYDHLDSFQIKGKSVYKIVNGVFIGSILFFLSVVTFIVIKISDMGKVFQTIL